VCYFLPVMPQAPLAGYRVLELAHLVAGPVCGLYLADMGADVVKVEAPGAGDLSRTIFRETFQGESSFFVTVNRNKRAVTIDLARPEGRALFRRLAATADVVLEAYRGGVAERLGVDYDALAAVNPRLVYCSLSAFGPTGGWREKPGLDAIVQALGGLMAVTGEPDRGPVLCGAPVIDTMGALLAGQGIVTALLHRERTGVGQRVDVSLLAGAVLSQAARLAVFHVTGEDLPRTGSAHPSLAPYQAFRAKDDWLFVAAWNERLWPPFCGAIGRPALAEDARFKTNADRIAHRAELEAALGPVFRQRTVSEWMAALEAVDVLCSPIHNYTSLVQDPQVRASGMLTEQDHPRAGRFPTIGTAIRFARTPGTIRTPAPALGEHTDEVLEGIGCTRDEIDGWRQAGLI